MIESGLSKWGFTQERVSTSAADIHSVAANLESYELHVIRNHVVSLPCYYRLSETGNIIDAKTKKELVLDQRERGGWYETGIKNTLNIAKNNPGNLVFLYSPSGLASFEEEPPEDYAKPYNIGQLYLLWYDGDKFINFGISINGEGEEWLKEIFALEMIDYNNTLTEKERITNYITTPVRSCWTIDDFLNRSWQFNKTVFSSKSFQGIKHFDLYETLSELRNSLMGKLRATIDGEVLARKLALEGGSTESGYKSLIYDTMQRNRVSSIPLGGGCGGQSISEKDLFNNSLSNLSSDYRRIIQRSGKNEQMITELECTCPFCKKKVIAEIKNNIIICPECKKTAPYYC